MSEKSNDKEIIKSYNFLRGRIRVCLDTLHPTLMQKFALIVLEDGKEKLIYNPNPTILDYVTSSIQSINDSLFSLFDNINSVDNKFLQKYNENHKHESIHHINIKAKFFDYDVCGVLFVVNVVNLNFEKNILHDTISPMRSTLTHITSNKVIPFLSDPNNFFATIGNIDVIDSGVGYAMWISLKSLDIPCDFMIHESITEISRMNYEKKKTIGKIKFQKNGDDVEIKYKDRISWQEIKNIRKSIESLSPDQCVIATNDGIVGIGYNDESIPGIEFIITGNGSWIPKIVHENTTFSLGYEFREGVPKITTKSFSIEEIKDKISKNHIDGFHGNWESIQTVIDAVTTMSKGCIVIFSQSAESECNRLIRQCYRIHPVKFNKEKHIGLFNIDGAVIVDMKGDIFGYGLILDGLGAPDTGDRSRGSRFNSVKKYIQLRHGLAFGVVLSDDGNFDIIYE